MTDAWPTLFTVQAVPSLRSCSVFNIQIHALGLKKRDIATHIQCLIIIVLLVKTIMWVAQQMCVPVMDSIQLLHRQDKIIHNVLFTFIDK